MKINAKLLLSGLLTLSVGAGTVGTVFAADLKSTPDRTLTIVAADKSERVVDAGDYSTVSSVLAQYGEDAGSYTDKDGSTITGFTLLSETSTVYRKNASAEEGEMTIPFKTETRDSADLYVGTEKVEVEGKEGKAKRTKVVSVGSDGKEKVSEVLTLISSPTTKVILRGTKPLPVDEPKREVVSTPVQAATGNAAVDLAYAQVGKPYVWGSTGPNAFDCSGLIYWIYSSNLGRPIPRTAYEQGLSGQQISMSDLQPGDVVYSPTHIGLYIGNGQIIHASTPSTGVIVSPLSWFNGYKAARLG